MHPVLFHIGHSAVYSYTVLLALGLICGLGLACVECKRLLGSPWLAVDAVLFALVAAVIGGRLGYVAQNHLYFTENPGEAFLLWRGGSAFWGAFPVGMVALAAYAWHRGRGRSLAPTFWSLADATAPGLALGQAFGWLGCLAHGCVYGRTGEGFLYRYLPDIYGVSASRFATQAVGAVLSLIIFTIVWLWRKRWPFHSVGFLVCVILSFG
ncbi:MAG: prolipoprotein diacylglyceryl transferase family protein, partial [Chloroflexota bacterium]|nr:prolipoprotein diacylglyceryl transferase family protein [Chloroflexota bacterium]